ncbi:MATE family efflux transporter [Cognatishimia activa]|uniref:Multidrug-efflux transporter n=1 Tax=Cognatishimia activa TaxID=1715691 RepID=A0A0P1IQA4_9RHOB|nr:MATE family efflux transporter [Cognatishimia activa]CUJ11109.1 Multidrug-efflux transporter [Cognatishimia activa]CUK25762.1 Multidrug-efflux transporter [Cognatishimia activa]
MAHSEMTYGAHARAVLTLGLPLVGGHVAQFAVNLTDTVMLGWYGVDELAAVVLGGQLFFLAFILGSGFAFAVMPLVAAALADEDETLIRRTSRMGIWLSVIYGLVMIPIFWWSKPIFVALGQDPALSEAAQSYLRIAGLGIVPALIIMVLKSFLAALEHTRVVFWITVLAAATNALVNYALIFGNWGAPELGIIGAAIASLVVQFVMVTGAVIYTLGKLPQYDLFTRLWKPDFDAMKRVFLLGVPIGFTTLAEVGLFAAGAVMMGWLGTVQLAAHGIALNLAGLMFMVHLGLGNAATVRAGNAYGRHDVEHLARGARVAIFMSLAFAVFSIIVFITWPEWLMSLFLGRDDPNFDIIIQVGATLLLAAAFFQFVDGAQALALGILRGIMDTRVPMIMAAISYWAVGVPASYFAGFVLGWGGVGVWVGLGLGLGVAALLLMWRFWVVRIAEMRNAAPVEA